jgi:hypothetical protein
MCVLLHSSLVQLCFGRLKVTVRERVGTQTQLGASRHIRGAAVCAALVWLRTRTSLSFIWTRQL